jgi:uncharacterized lipoprotein
MIRFFTCVLITFSLLLTGCSYLSKKKDALLPNQGKLYLKSKETPALQVPAGIPADSVGDAYIIPPVAGPAPTTPPSLLPPGSLAEQIAQGKVSPNVLKQKIVTPKVKPIKL